MDPPAFDIQHEMPGPAIEQMQLRRARPRMAVAIDLLGGTGHRRCYGSRGNGATGVPPASSSPSRSVPRRWRGLLFASRPISIMSMYALRSSLSVIGSTSANTLRERGRVVGFWSNSTLWGYVEVQ